MTENDAKKLIAKFCEDRMNFARGNDMSDKELDGFCKFSDALNLSISSLEEIQQYRAIGTVEEIKRMQRYSTLAKKHSTIGQVIDSCAEYEAIGTVQECREAREKQRAKKPLQGEPYTWTSSVRVRGRYRDVQKTSYHHVCPNCRENVAMDMSCCKYCGQAIDWSGTE